MKLYSTLFDIYQRRSDGAIITNIFSGTKEILNAPALFDDKYYTAKQFLILWRKRSLTDEHKITSTFSRLYRLIVKKPSLFTAEGIDFINRESKVYSAEKHLPEWWKKEYEEEIEKAAPSTSDITSYTTGIYSIPTTSDSYFVADSSSSSFSIPRAITPEHVKKLMKEYASAEEFNPMTHPSTYEEEKEEQPAPSLKKFKLQDLAQKVINFFSEFEFEPNFRFMNSLAQFDNSEKIKSFISNYFALTDNPYKQSIVEKMKSYEFEQIADSFISLNTKNKINNRFKLYFGSQGTGKTTKAMEESDGVCMVCHSAMLPSDLMEDFKFEDGKAIFTPSALQEAMVNGTIITLDEINLLPFESLRFLQSILDGKKEFIYKGKTIEIKDGFKVIGTMNLMVNGSIFSLPEPLVDRAEDLIEYKLTAENLVNALE